MTEAAARHGYAATSVARVVERARVSRATFYEHFRDREECFEAAYQEAAAGLASALRRAERRVDDASVSRALVEAFLKWVAANSSAARLLLVEAMATDLTLRVLHERALVGLEGEVERSLRRLSAAGLSVPLLPPAAIVGGIAGTVSAGVLDGRAESLQRRLGELLAWLDAYVPSDPKGCWGADRWAALGRELPPLRPGALRRPLKLLPRGRSALDPAHASAVKRERILEATARLVAERGYAELTVKEIVAEARTSRRAFYSHFHGKADAFGAAQGIALQESIGAATAAFFSPGKWPERVWEAGGAMLTYIASHPELAQLGIVETYAAGEEAIRRQHDSRIAYTIFLEEGYRLAGSTAPPRIASDAIAWAVFALLRREVVAGRTVQLLELQPVATYAILAPFTGPSAALEFVQTRSRAVSQGARAAR